MTLCKPLVQSTFLCFAVLSSAASCAALPKSEVISFIEQAEEKLLALEDRGLVGSVVVSCANEAVFEADIGLSTDPSNVIHYEIASISKWLTSILVLHLQEQDVLALDDRLDLYFPNAPSHAAPITIRQLLTHRSGLQQTYRSEGHSDLNHAADAILEQKLAFPPGSDFSYSNDNYSLLAMIVEIAVQKPYASVLHETVTEPLGLPPITFWPSELQEGAISPPLLNPRVAPEAGVDWGFLGGHGASASVQTLHSILSALDSGKILSEPSIEVMQTAYSTSRSGTGIGMGWYTRFDEQGRETAFTSGSDDSGGNAVIHTFSADDLVIIAATNAGPSEEEGPGWSRQVRNAMIEVFANEDAPQTFCAIHNR